MPQSRSSWLHRSMLDFLITHGATATMLNAVWNFATEVPMNISSRRPPPCKGSCQRWFSKWRVATSGGTPFPMAIELSEEYCILLRHCPGFQLSLEVDGQTCMAELASHSSHTHIVYLPFCQQFPFQSTHYSRRFKLHHWELLYKHDSFF
jgi:hypothetical protein